MMRALFVVWISGLYVSAAVGQSVQQSDEAMQWEIFGQ